MSTSPVQELYTEPDRGTFMAARLFTHSGPAHGNHCRIVRAKVFNYLTDKQYALVSYQIQHWDPATPAPYAGGTGKAFIPKNKPNQTTLYFRTARRNTLQIQALEEAIINDFVVEKLSSDPMTYLSFAQAAEQQIMEANQVRTVEGAEFTLSVQVTQYDADAEKPLTLSDQYLTYFAKDAGDPTPPAEYRVTNVGFTRIADLVTVMINNYKGR